MKRDDVMKTIQGAEVCPGNAGVIKVPLSDFRHVAEGLRNDPQSPMDFLRDIVGMDWGEEGLGAIYFMESTVTGDTIAHPHRNNRPPTAVASHRKRFMEDCPHQRTRGIRLLRHPVYRPSGHAPSFLAGRLDRLAAAQRLRYEIKPFAFGQ